MFNTPPLSLIHSDFLFLSIEIAVFLLWVSNFCIFFIAFSYFIFSFFPFFSLKLQVCIKLMDYLSLLRKNNNNIQMLDYQTKWSWPSWLYLAGLQLHLKLTFIFRKSPKVFNYIVLGTIYRICQICLEVSSSDVHSIVYSYMSKYLLWITISMATLK